MNLIWDLWRDKYKIPIFLSLCFPPESSQVSQLSHHFTYNKQYKSSLPKAQSQTHTQTTQPSAKSQNHSFLALKLKLLLCVFSCFLKSFYYFSHANCAPRSPSPASAFSRDSQLLNHFSLQQILLSYSTIWGQFCSFSISLIHFLRFCLDTEIKKERKKKERGRVLLSWARLVV